MVVFKHRFDDASFTIEFYEKEPMPVLIPLMAGLNWHLFKCLLERIDCLVRRKAPRGSLEIIQPQLQTREETDR
jgi:hypothetical protein